MKVAFVYMNNEPNVGRGAGYVAGSIIRSGYDLTFFDTYVVPIKDIAMQIARGDFDIVMISTMTMLFAEALNLIKTVKRLKNIPVLIGGVHPTIIGKQLLEQHEDIDYLCIGEGESMVIEFLKQFGKDSLFKVQNLAYRCNGRIHQNSVRSAEDLSKLPTFPWHLFQKSSIVQKGDGFHYVNATRGCPYNCTYCSNGIYLKHYGKSYLRFRPVGHVIEELKFLKKRYPPSLFYFGDEMMLSNMGYIRELFKAVKEEINSPYGCMARVEHITPELVDLFKKTGCQYIGMGVECGDEAFRKKYLNRQMSNQEIENAFSLLKKAGIFVTSFNMIGYPFDYDDFLTEETIKLTRKLQPDYTQISIFYPFPGTELYQRCVDLNLIDLQKVASTGDYFTESVLKGVSLKKKLEEINLLLNPQGFNFKRFTAPSKQPLKAISSLYQHIRCNPSFHYIAGKLPLSIKEKIKNLECFLQTSRTVD